MTSAGISYFPARWFVNNTSSSTMCFSDMKVISNPLHLHKHKVYSENGHWKNGYWCTILISIPLISLVHHDGQSDVVHRPPPYALNLICSQPQPIKWHYGVYASNLIGKDSLPQPIRCGEYTYHLNLHASLYFPSTLLTLYHWTLM